MKKILFQVLFTAIILPVSAQVAINNDGSAPDASAMLDVKSTNSGILIPRMTATEMNNITSPATGLLVFVTDNNTFYYYDGSAWVQASADNLGNHTATENIKTNGHWISNDGDDEGIYIHEDGWVSIGNSAHKAMLHIKGDDPDIELNMNSSSTVASWIELRFSVDDTIRSHIYLHKDTHDLYFINDKQHENKGDIYFRNNYSDALIIKNDGKIGINTTNPGQQLDVNGNIKHGHILYHYSSAATSGTRRWIQFRDGDEYGDQLFLSNNGTTVIGSGEGPYVVRDNIDQDGTEILYLTSDRNNSYEAIKFITGLQTGWDDRVEAMTILGNGKVGIGLNDPTGYLNLAYRNDAGPNGTSQPGGDFMIGPVDGTHLEIDNNEIHAMADESNPGTLYLNLNGGTVSIGVEDDAVVSINAGGTSYALNLPNNSDEASGQARAYAWVTYSDRRVKSQIESIQNPLEIVKKLRPVHYTHHSSRFLHLGENKTDEKNKNNQNGFVLQPEKSSTEYGYIAQELYRVVPEAVYKPANEQTDLWGVNYSMIIPILNAAIIEQQKTIEELKRRIEALEKQNNR